MEMTPDDVRFLDPDRTRLFRAAGITRLTIENDRSWIRCSVARAFPISDPDHYIGFLDGDGKEIGVIHDVADLDPESRETLASELELRYFVPSVRKVIRVKEEFGSVYWTLDTDRGRAEMIIRNLKDNLQELGASRVMITDIDGNRFEFPDIYKLDSESLGIIIRNL